MTDQPSLIDALPPPEVLTQIFALTFCVAVVVVAYSGRHQIAALFMAFFSRYVTIPTLDDIADRVSPRQDAEIEMPEMPETRGPSPAELDRTIKAASAEAVARAIGTLTGAGIIDPAQRSKALLKAGIQGERYTRLKPVVDAAQAAAQAEQPAPPPPPAREILVYAGRPEERAIKYDDPALNYAEPPQP